MRRCVVGGVVDNVEMRCWPFPCHQFNTKQIVYFVKFSQETTPTLSTIKLLRFTTCSGGTSRAGGPSMSRIGDASWPVRYQARFTAAHSGKGYETSGSRPELVLRTSIIHLRKPAARVCHSSPGRSSSS